MQTVNAPKTTATYRTTLTPEMVTKVLNLAKLESPLSTASATLIAKFAPLQAKIDNAGIVPAYTTTGRESVLSSLGGLTQKDTTSALYTLDSKSYLSKEEYWEACYDLYKVHPEQCTLGQITGAEEHAYLNDLMTEAETAKFEAGSA